MRNIFIAITTAMLVFSVLALVGCGNPAGTDTDVLEIPYRTDSPAMIHPPVYYLPPMTGK